MKKVILFLIAATLSSTAFAQIYMAQKCEVSFFSPTPLKDLAAVNTASKPLLNIATGDVQIKIVMTAFVFEKPLMQEHFNENYVESEKFPNAFFKGKINEKVDYTKDGEQKVTVTGKFTIHGIEKDRTIDGTIKIDGQRISISSTFRLSFADYKIEIPSLYTGIIPSDTEVKISATLEPFKKK